MLTIRAGSVTVPAGIPYPTLPPPLRRLPEVNPHLRSNWLPLPPEIPRPSLGWNELHYPVWGATRYSEMNVLITGSDWAAIRATTFSGNVQVTVAWDDGNAGCVGSLGMLVVDAFPVSDSRFTPSASTVGTASDDDILWQLVLSDYRWLRSPFIMGTGDPPLTTWGDLISHLLSLAGATITPSTINALITAAGVLSYDPPTDVWKGAVMKGLSVTAMLDAACAAVGLRVLHKLDGNLEVQSHVSALSALATLPVGDHSFGGYIRKRDKRAAQMNIVRYNGNGLIGIYPGVSVPGAVMGQVTVWSPHTSSVAFARTAADYSAWNEPDVPVMEFAGFPVLPNSALIDTYILRHEEGVSVMTVESETYPWPLIGDPGSSGGGDAVFNICVTKDVYGAITGISYVTKSGDVYTCREVEECCTSPPPPHTATIVVTVTVDGSPSSGRSISYSGGGSFVESPAGTYTLTGVTPASGQSVALTNPFATPYNWTVSNPSGMGSSLGNPIIASPVTTVAGDTTNVTFAG